MQSNLCSACGGTLPENAAFCPSCGTAQFQTYGATVPSQPPTNYGGNPYLNNPYAPPPPPPSSQPARWKSLGVMGAVSVVLILIIVNALVFIHPTNFLATATSQPGATASATHTNATATAQAV